MTEIPDSFNHIGRPSLITATPGSTLRLRGNRRSARRLLYVSFMVIAVLFGGFFVWAALSDISGAVVASGTVKVESSVKKVQNLSGGIISEIRVKEGDSVTAGDVLIRLDPQSAQSEWGIISDQLNAMIVRHARLMAERDGQTFDPSALVLDENPKGIAPSLIRRGETELFMARRDALKGQKNVLSERKAQFENQIEGDQA